MIRTMILLSLLVACTGCSEFALLASGSSVAISQNIYAKAYSGVDFITVITTEKDIRTHVYHNLKEAMNGKPR